MYFTDHRAAKQTRLGLGTVRNQIHPGSLGWPSGRHDPRVNLPRTLEKFTRGIYSLVNLKTLLGLCHLRLTLENGILRSPISHCFYASAKSYPRRYGVNIASEFTVTEHPVLNLYFAKTSLVSLNECSTQGGVSPTKSVVQSASQYDVTSRVSNFQNGEQIFIEKTDKNFDFITEMLFRFLGFGGFKVAIFIEN